MKQKKASECKCVECGKQAVAFWPIIDPDIPSQPYCRKCLNRAKERIILDFFVLRNVFEKRTNG